MYNSQMIAERIKSQAKSKNISINQMLSLAGLGRNTVVKIANGTDILTLNFAKIAEILECSVDYLLGRTDTPQIQGNISTGNIGNNNIGNNNTGVIYSGTETDKTTAEIVEMLNDLDIVQKAEIILKINEMKNASK